MYTASSPQPVGCVASRTLNDKNLIEMVDRCSSSPPRVQVVPSLGKPGVSHVSDGACEGHGAAGAVLMSHGDPRWEQAVRAPRVPPAPALRAGTASPLVPLLHCPFPSLL